MSDARPTTVMIVEDEEMLQEVYQLVLEMRGYHVVTANNGHEALEKLRGAKPRIILLDMLMPVMDGKEFMRNLDLDEHDGLKVIVYSNLSDSAVKTEMMELGASKFVLKSSMTPADLVELVQSVEA